MSDKGKRPTPPSPGRGSGGSGPSTDTGEDTSNAQMVTLLGQASLGTVFVPLGGTLELPDVSQLPDGGGASAGGGTGVLDDYKTWVDAVKALRAFEDQHNNDLFSYGLGDLARERITLTDAVQKSFSAMSPAEQQIIYESEKRLYEWKKDFDAQTEAKDKERRRVWMYEYAGLDPNVWVSPRALNEAFERAKEDKARQSLRDDITAIPNMIGEDIQDISNSFYSAAHAPKTGNEGWIDGAAKSLWNLGVDGVHMLGHTSGSTAQIAGEMAGGAAVTAADPGGTFDRFVEDKESSRKNISQTLADGGGGGGFVTEAHAAILAYTPGVQDIGEGFSNASLESPEQTEAWKNRSVSDRVVQSAGGISELSGTLAGVGGAATNLKKLIKPKPGKAPVPLKPGVADTMKQLDNGPSAAKLDVPTTMKNAADGPAAGKVKPKTGNGPDAKVGGASAGARAATPDARTGRFWEDPEFMGGKMDDATSTAVRKELTDEIDGMNLSPQELKKRGLDKGLTGLNNAPDEWMPKYRQGSTNSDAFPDLWGTNKSTNSRHAAEAATKKLDEYRGLMARGEVPTGKLHWSQYGDTPEAAVHSLRRLSKTYSLMEGKIPMGNPTARARAAIFDTLADWAEKTEGLIPR